MLDTLNVLNGKLSPEFDRYNNIYSVLVSSDTTFLIMDYTTVGDCFIDITGNSDFKNGENIVNIKTICDEDENDYVLYVYQSSSKKEYQYEINVVEKVLPPYIPIVIGSTCFILIVVIFIIIFGRHSK